VAIIGILAAIAIPGYIGMQERGRKALSQGQLLQQKQNFRLASVSKKGWKHTS